MRLRELTNEATGLSPATLSSYKKKAGAEASALDKEAFEKGGPGVQAKLDKAHKRYKGINKATQKQFDNDAKGIVEMDSQGYTGSRDGGDPDAGKKEYYGKAVKAKDVAKQGLSHLHKALDRALSKEKKASPAQQQRNKERWAKRQAELEQGVAEGTSTTWEVSYDYGPHMTKTVKVKASSEEEAAAKVEKAAEKKGLDIMINSVTPVDLEEGWKEKAGAAALAGAMATGASGVVLNPARPIGPATATRPAPTVANPNPAAHPLSPLNPSSPTYVAKAKVVNIHGKEYLRHELPQDMSKVTKTTDDAGNEIYAWTEKSGMRPQYTYRWFAPVQSVKEQGVAEGSEERSQKRLWAQITDYEQRAKATKNDIKRDHYLKMASELRGKLKTTDDVEESQVNEISTKLRDKYVTRATDDYGHANFAARASKSHPGLEKYSQEQETRAKKRAAGLNRALSDKRLGRVEESNDNTVSFEVDSERAYNHIMDKFGHVIEWDGDAMVIPSKYWGAVQELAYAAGGEATEYNTVDEASLATMRDYFAGDENAKDEMKITQMRKYYANDAAKEKTKKFNSLASYHHWLKQVGAEKINRK